MTLNSIWQGQTELRVSGTSMGAGMGWGQAGHQTAQGSQGQAQQGIQGQTQPQNVQPEPQGWAEARQPMGLALQGPWVGRARQWGAGDWPCCAVPRAGTDIPEDWDGVPGHKQPWGDPREKLVSDSKNQQYLVCDKDAYQICFSQLTTKDFKGISGTKEAELPQTVCLRITSSVHLEASFLCAVFLNYIFQLAAICLHINLPRWDFSSPLISVRSPSLHLSQLL